MNFKSFYLPLIAENELYSAVILSLENKYALFIHNGKETKVILGHSNIVNYLKKENLPIIQRLAPAPLIEKTFNFFNNTITKPLWNSPEEVVFQAIDTEKLKKNYQDYLQKWEKLKENYKIEFADKNYFIGNEKIKKNIKFDINSTIEQSLATAKNLNKFAFFYGVTGSGKTYGIREFCKRNDIKLFETNVANDGDVRKAIFGSKQITQDEEGQKISPTYAGGVESFREVVLNKNMATLFIDEMQRGENGGVGTIFNPTEIKGEKVYEIEGTEEYQIVEIENIFKEKGIVLLTREKPFGIKNNKILKALPSNATKEEIEWNLKNGNISKVNKKYLEQNDYKIKNYLGNIKEKFLIPVNMLIVATASNIGYSYDMASKIDIALLSRSLVTEINPASTITPDEMFKILRKEMTPKITNQRQLSEEEQKIKEKFIMLLMRKIYNFVNSDLLPLKAYTPRNFATLLEISSMPNEIKHKDKVEEINIVQYLSYLIDEHLKINYINFNVGEEGFEFDEEQKENLSACLESVKEEMIENKIKKTFNPEQELKSDSMQIKASKIGI